LVGFTWTFFQAGAHNVIAGLWDVSDESTPQIMDRLYGGLAGGQSIAEALRSAKLSLVGANGRFRLPYYWGALQLYCRDHPEGRRNKRAAAVASK
jgi:CHAT domain-containing protein